MYFENISKIITAMTKMVRRFESGSETLDSLLFSAVRSSRR
ncbi:hypothetical protein IMSAGC021_01719 [Muribaculaceae bacterium]|nr:hypothetical protein IMSAGC021_01719 [Muribaculaceae bacterium]